MLRTPRFLVAVALCCISALDSPSKLGAQWDSISISLSVEYPQDAEFEAQLASFFRRELRDLPGVRISRNPNGLPVDDFALKVFGLPVTVGGSDLAAGHAVTIGLFGRCDPEDLGPYEPLIFGRSIDDEEWPTAWEEAYQEVSPDDHALAALMALWHACRLQVGRWLVVWPRSADFLREIRALLAEIDTKHLEPLRE